MLRMAPRILKRVSDHVIIISSIRMLEPLWGILLNTQLKCHTHLSRGQARSSVEEYLEALSLKDLKVHGFDPSRFILDSFYRAIVSRELSRRMGRWA